MLTNPDFAKIHDELHKLYKGKEARARFGGVGTKGWVFMFWNGVYQTGLGRQAVFVC